MFYILDRRTGDVRWSYDIHQDGKQTSFHGDPLVLGSTVLVGTDLGCAPDGIGHVYAFDLQKKSVRWKQRFKGVPTSVILSGKDIFFGSAMDEWYKADPATGIPIWVYQVNAADTTCGTPREPVIAGGNAYILGQDSLIYILEVASGKLLKKIQPASFPTTALAIYHGHVLFGAEDNQLYSFDPGTSQVRALQRFNGKPAGRLEIDGNFLCLFLEGPGQKGQLASVDLNTNTLRWTQTAEREWASVTPRIWHNQILAGNCRGRLSAFSLKDGKELWSKQFKGCIRSIGTSDDLLYIGSQEGMLYAFAPGR